MKLEWDEAKRSSNLIKHGVDFEDLRLAFVSPQRVEVLDDRRDYGEPRIVVLCPMRGRLLHITYALRRNARRIISARKANRREQTFYERCRADQDGGGYH